MRLQSGLTRFPTLSRAAAVGLAATLLGACSADTLRFASDPFSNPFATSQRFEPATTGSLPPASAAPTTVVMAEPLAPPPAAAPVVSAPLAAPSPAAAPAASARPAGWTALGGTPVVVREGETAASIAARYNVPQDALLRANGLSSAADVRPGRSIVIPVFNATGAQVASAAPVAPAAAAPAAAPVPPRAPASRAASAPAARPAAAAAPTPPARGTQAASAQPAAAAAPPAPARVASASATAPAAAPPPAAAPAASAPSRTAALPDVSSSRLDFRWPARGRVISGFGNAGNEGINIALPEGTPVRAAEGGTVAYAGDELRGYGKLILIRHADGYVSAYAHNSELLVRRGEEVRRGQVIANSGRTGNVTSPQLHFEIRRGADPVDPMPYLTN